MSLPLYQARPQQSEVTIYLRTYGCSHNISDSEYMAGQLQQQGYAITQDENQADLLIINSCTVKGPSQESFFHALKSAQKPVVVAGCVPQADRKHPQLANISVIGVQQLDRVVEAVEETLRGNTVRFLDKATRPSLQLPKVRRNPLIEIIPISTGCLGACTYCKTKHARGHLGSYPPEEILARVQTAVNQGVKQLWLTSEDSGAYGRDIGTNLPALIRSILSVIPHHIMIRIGMTNPPYIKEHVFAIAETLRHPQVFSFLHIPVQSGNNKVLADMRREYTVQEFLQVIADIKSSTPECTIATDIICGFPSETPEDFNDTLRLVEVCKFPILNISQFYPRPGTPAARMQLLPTQEVKRRSTELTALFKQQLPYQELVGRELPVWVSDRNEDGNLVGHTKSYALVLLEGGDELLGVRVIALITSAGKHFVRGKVLSVEAS